MASSSSFSEEDYTCSICHDIFKDPVLLLCSHSFCKDCLQEYWKQKKPRECPLCRRISSMKNPPRNLALKNLCDTILNEEMKRVSFGLSALCSEHGEKLHLFCTEDQQLICLVCRDSIKHKHHNCRPTKEVVDGHKEELQTALSLLKEKMKAYGRVKKTFEKTENYIKIQTEDTETQIKEQFKMLHQFLQEEEEARIAALRVEEEQKSQRMKEKIEGLIREMSTLSDSIRAIEEELGAEDISFLRNYKVTMKRAQCTLPDPQLVSGALIDTAKHLGNLSFRVWEKMKERVRFTPVVLDPNNAHPCALLSDDLTSVRYTDTEQQLPDNPERNTYYATVLGAEGFRSGVHSWEVEVGDHPEWEIGVANESADRKGVVDLDPENGIWRISLFSGVYYDVVENTLPVERNPQRIRVQLDYDRGELSFYDPEDMSLIYSDKDTFTEKLYPYFNTGPADDAQHPDIKISQSEVSVSVISS